MSDRRMVGAARRGFTLVEMAIVLVILGVIAAIGLPRYATALRHQRVNLAAQVVAADLELAAALAARERVPLQLVIDPAEPGYALTRRGGGPLLLRRTLGAGSEWQLGAMAASPGVVEFYPGGTLSAPLRLVLGGADHQRTVTVTRAGLVRVRP